MDFLKGIKLPPPVTPRHPLLAGVLDELAKRHRSDPLGELAREVLAGRISIREAALSSAYAEPLSKAIDDGTRHLTALDPAELAALAEEVSQLNEAARAQPPAEPAPLPPPVRRPRADDSDDDDWNGRSIMVSPRGR